MEDKEMFEIFLKEYLENVKKKLPESYRATQLKTGGLDAELVYHFETEFLAEPFSKALKLAREDERKKRDDEQLKKDLKNALDTIEMKDKEIELLQNAIQQIIQDLEQLKKEKRQTRRETIEEIVKLIEARKQFFGRETPVHLRQLPEDAKLDMMQATELCKDFTKAELDFIQKQLLQLLEEK